MNRLLWIVVLVLTLCGCAAAPSLPTYLETAHPGINGTVESWSAESKPVSSTLSMWNQEIEGSNYALVQLRAGLDTYRFALSREQVALVLDAINNYQLIVSETSSDHGPAICWLCKIDIKLKRLGDSAKADKLIIDIERNGQSPPILVLTFESWLLSFGGPDSPAGRAYKEVTYSPMAAVELRANLEKVYEEL